jgi:hypothetical protein
VVTGVPGTAQPNAETPVPLHEERYATTREHTSTSRAGRTFPRLLPFAIRALDSVIARNGQKSSVEEEIETRRAFGRKISLLKSHLFSCTYWVRGKAVFVNPLVCALSWARRGFEGFRGVLTAFVLSI